MKIKKSSLEWVLLLSAYLLSFFNNITLLVFLLGILLLLKQKQIGALKIINILTLRSIISPAVAVSVGNFEILKVLIMIGCSIYLMSNYFQLEKSSKKRLKWVMGTVIVFTIYNIVVAFFVSSLPTVATFKALNYSVVFLGVLVGVARTIRYFDIFGWLLKWFKVIMGISLITIPLPIAYVVNGRGFQGIINHPNMFGIVAVLFIAFLLGRKKEKNDYFYIIASILMIILSQSRTSLISVIVVLALYIIVNYVKKLTLLKVAIASFTAAGLLLIYNQILGFFGQFLAKGQTLDNVLYSREGQVKGLLYNFQQNPFFGSGFGVPVLPYRNFRLSLDFTVEPGNLMLAVLSYGGVIGFIIFAVYMLQILFSNKASLVRRPYLFVAPIMISMGEMVFFSSNSIAPFCYMLFAMYMFYGGETERNEDIKVIAQ